MSNISIIIDSTGDTVTQDKTVYFPNPIELKNLQYQIGLQRLDLSYSWYNVSATIGNNTFRYWNNVAYKVVTIDDGVYSLTDLTDEISDLITLEGDTPGNILFELDISDGYTSLILAGGYKVDFTNRTIRNIFGFNSAEYAASVESPNRSNINNNVTSVYVHCDLINSSYINGNPTDVIFSFKINHQQNEIISIEPNVIQLLPINTRSQINSMRCYFTDQTNKLLDFNSQPFSAQFVLSPILNF